MLQRRASDRTVAELREIGRQTLLSLTDEYGVLSRLRRAQQEEAQALRDIRESVSQLVEIGCQLDVERLNDEQFEEITSDLGGLIEAFERHFVEEFNSTDVAHCQVVGEAIRQLKDMSHWIAQGLSPDPSRRPSDEELVQRTHERAAAAFQALSR